MDIIDQKSAEKTPTENINLKSIENLACEGEHINNYRIKTYQRGYRWGEEQTRLFLEDIWSYIDFGNTKRSDKERYFLSPLVVKQGDNENSWIVVDGQQRLTTILLIMSVLDIEPLYSIQYDRKYSNESLDYLLNHDKPIEAELLTHIQRNPDYFYMSKSKRLIQDWIEENLDDTEKKNSFKNTLLKEVVFLWYDIGPGNEDFEICKFRDLNMGKIPLTDAELIKALLLGRTYYYSNNTENDEERCKSIINDNQRKLSREWDQIEFGLQNDKFWLFLSGANDNRSTRIELILDLICIGNLLDCPYINTGNSRKTFNYFYHYFDCIRKIDDIKTREKMIKNAWDKINECYIAFKEWYADYKLFHYIGWYLIAREDRKKEEVFNAKRNNAKTIVGKETFIENNLKTILQLFNSWTELGKASFIEYVKWLIIHELSKYNWIEEWESYDFDTEKGSSKRECRPLLLLHNIQTTVLQNEKYVEERKFGIPDFTRFPFHLYKREHWDIEHISSNSGDNFDDDKVKEYYLNIIKDYFVKFDAKHEINKQIDDYLKTKETSKFKAIIDNLGAYECTIDREEINRIWNFTLLDSSTNREYHNVIFPIKRIFLFNKENGYKINYECKDNNIVYGRPEKEIAFVPICTKNVFSKTYSKNPGVMTCWEPSDANAYLFDIKEKVHTFTDAAKIIHKANEIDINKRSVSGHKTTDDILIMLKNPENNTCIWNACDYLKKAEEVTADKNVIKTRYKGDAYEKLFIKPVKKWAFSVLIDEITEFAYNLQSSFELAERTKDKIKPLGKAVRIKAVNSFLTDVNNIEKDNKTNVMFELLLKTDINNTEKEKIDHYYAMLKEIKACSNEPSHFRVDKTLKNRAKTIIDLSYMLVEKPLIDRLCIELQAFKDIIETSDKDHHFGNRKTNDIKNSDKWDTILGEIKSKLESFNPNAGSDYADSLKGSTNVSWGIDVIGKALRQDKEPDLKNKALALKELLNWLNVWG